MKRLNFLTATAVISLAGCSSLPAWETKHADEHDAHRPATDSAPSVHAGKVNQQMKAMQDMHQKMMAAKTPAEGAALMKEHMKAMQDGMAMMGRMRGGMPMHGGVPTEKDAMQRRMDMMEMMMQMMMDREAVR